VRLAGEINSLHHKAIEHADKAINFAKQAGELLLQVKADLTHGDFLPWLAANCVVSPRQAQRYMAAAQGKPLPVSMIKSDTMSHLPAADTARELTPKQVADLARLERLEMIEQTLEDIKVILIQSGEAMRAIRDEHLYPTKYPTLEAYCWERFGMEPDVVADYLSGDWQRMFVHVAVERTA
jgi:hypothetical protein